MSPSVLMLGSAKLYLSEMDETGKHNKIVIWLDDLSVVLESADWQTGVYQRFFADLGMVEAAERFLNLGKQ